MRILAPHHDDVLLSLPALLSRHPGDLEVVVCFSEESDELAAVCNALHAELAVSVRLLGLTEAVRRGVSLRSCIRPLRGLQEVLADPLLGELSERLAGFLHDDRLLLAPLLPVHLDHALTRAAAERAAVRIGYYEDQPYASLHCQLSERLRAGLQGEWASPGSTSDAIAAILGRLRALVGPRQIARIEAAYPAAHVAERIWFPPLPGSRGAPARLRNTDSERSLH